MSESDARTPGPGARAHRLAEAPSQYLRAAAEQSIDWHPWGPEPFALARRTKRPILLDIGASWCHWCHVMDEGTYSDAEVARLIGQHFVAVKVDRDERPEVDRRYQREVGTLTGEGGWPLTAFLTPEGETFLGGTYFPAEDAVGRPGFRRVLREVSRLWKEEPDRIQTNAEAVRSALARNAERRSGTPEETAVIASVRNDLAAHLDPTNGGFGDAPKFFHTEALRFWLVDGIRSGSSEELASVQRTLRAMADGGVCDQIGGGFHRYSVDAAWRIPHFEKMGTDNAELLDLYVDAAMQFDDPRFPEVIRDSLGWIETALLHPEGGFSASQDADNAPGDDGGFYTWTRSELRDALDPLEYRLAARCFGIGTEARMPHDPDRSVLFRLLPPEEAAEGLEVSAEKIPDLFRSARSKLARVRNQRARPTVDSALYAGINGQFIRALSKAGRWMEDSRVVAHAKSAAERFLRHAYDAQRGVAHQIDGTTARGWGLLEDQLEFSRGLLELAATTLEPSYLIAGRDLLRLVHSEFTDASTGLREIAPRLYEDREATEGATAPAEHTPAADADHCATAALAQFRLGALTGDPQEIEIGGTYLDAARNRLPRSGLFAAGPAFALLLQREPPARVVVEGSGTRADHLVKAAWSSSYPNLVVFRGTPPPPFTLPTEQREALTRAGEKVRALVCFGTRCEAPITEPSELRARLQATSVAS